MGSLCSMFDQTYTEFINGGRAERPGFEYMEARLGRPHEIWSQNRVGKYSTACTLCIRLKTRKNTVKFTVISPEPKERIISSVDGVTSTH